MQNDRRNLTARLKASLHKASARLNLLVVTDSSTIEKNITLLQTHQPERRT